MKPAIGKPRPRLVIVGGPDVHLRGKLVAELAADFDVHVLGSAGDVASVFEGAGADYRPYPLASGISPSRDLATVITLVRELRALRPHIVHTYDSKPSALGRLAGWIAGVPVIIGTLPGMGSLYVDERVATRLSRRIYEAAQRLASRLADITIVQNQEDLDDFVDRGVLVRSKAMLIPGGSGVDTERFRPHRLTTSAAARVRALLGLEDGTIVVTMAARIIRTKGVLEYAAAANRVRQESRQIRFLLVGADDPGSRDSLNPAEQRAVGQAVDCLGHQSDLADVLAITDVFVLPSFYMEGIPRVLLEAAATGLPIITTDIRGCRDVIDNGVSGILIPPRDAEALAVALLTLLRDPVRRSRLARQARTRAVRDFAVSAVAGRLKDVYLEQLGVLTSPGSLARGHNLRRRWRSATFTQPWAQRVTKP